MAFSNREILLADKQDKPGSFGFFMGLLHEALKSGRTSAKQGSEAARDIAHDAENEFREHEDANG